MATLKEIIEENEDRSYMSLVRNGESPREIAQEMGYTDCTNCGSWKDRCDMAIGSGMSIGDEICEHCLEHRSKDKWVQYAIQSTLDAHGGRDDWDLKQYLTTKEEN